MANPTLVFPGLSCVLAFHYSTPSNPDSCVPKHFTSGGHQGIEEGRNDGSAGWGSGGVPPAKCGTAVCWLRQEDQIPLISTRKRRKGGRGGEGKTASWVHIL